MHYERLYLYRVSKKKNYLDRTTYTKDDPPCFHFVAYCLFDTDEHNPQYFHVARYSQDGQYMTLV